MKDINLNSSEWCDIVFENKNKEYGAFKMRQTSSKRHVVAFVVMVIFAGFVAVLPTLIDAVKPSKDAQAGIDEAFQLSNIPVEEQIPEEDIIRQETAPPPPPLKATIQFTPPVITEDNKVKEENEMKSQSELSESKVQISIKTVEGTNDKNAVDIAELKDQKMVIEEKPEKPLTVVEQMPQFPGGDAEMMKYLYGAIKYPTIAAENGIQGRVVIRFVVGKDGVVSDVQVVRPLDPSLDKEAVRVVKTMPKWIPGKQNGRNVAVYYTLPVTFKLQN